MSTTDEETPSSPEPTAGVQFNENPGPIKIDPACIRDALRMYFQPIKNDDPVLDFYTMYKRETMEYDTEYMNKCNEDLNTTLIFAGLFSAVSSAFVIAFQPGLQQDPSDRSEAYLRAILLSINPSISPDEHPTPTSTWNGPPQEIVTTLDLLYASLLMSLLAAFVAMLGKQWLNRYLRHTGGSMIERCGDRQRKFDGIEKWPFRAFIESLPMMLQIALFLLTSGLSRYMWSINGSVSRVIISFTLLSFFFYIGIVIAGTSSYECPFQTPASAALRGLKDSGAAKRILTRASSLIHTLSPVVSDNIRKLKQAIRKSTRAAPLPSTVDDTNVPPPAPQDSTGLRIKVRDLEGIQKQNMANGRCVCWVLRNMTDPEAIDFAICLAGIIRWFDGGLDYDPPFDTIVSFFMACFDSAKQLYPSMRDRAYFSARAILQIHVRARGQPYERARRYPIPVTPSSLLPHADNDLHNLLDILATLRDPEPILEFPDTRIHTPVHSSWVSSLFVDLLSVSPNLPLFRDPRYYLVRPGVGYLSAATTNHRVVIANILIMADILLGGHIDEETFWAVDKSDSLETIFSHLSTTVIKAITPKRCPRGLDFLLGFLVAWKKRPNWLAPFAFRWCCVILEGAPTASTYSLGCEPFTLEQIRTNDRLAGTLEIGFRFIHLDYRSDQIGHPDYTSHFEKIFFAAASGHDEVIADALHAWIAHQDHTSHCPLEILFHKRKGVDEPFSPQLRRVSIRAIEDIWIKGFGVSAVLLKCLDVKLDEMEMGNRHWWQLILSAVRSSPDLALPLHHWRLLDDLVRYETPPGTFEDPCDVATMKLLEKNGEWEKLEFWMRVIWQFLERTAVTLVEGVERVTLKLLLRRPSAIPRFQELSMHISGSHAYLDRKLLELICTLAQAKLMPSAIGFLPAPPPSPGAAQITKSIEATPGSATAHPKPTYDSEPGGFCEGESGNGSGGTYNRGGGEGDQPPGITSIATHTIISPANQGAPPSPRAVGEQPMSYDSEQPHSGPTITTPLPARAVPNRPPPVENHPDNSTRCHPPLPSLYIPAPHESKQNTLTSGESVQNDECQKTTPAKEYVEDFWLGLGHQERKDLVEEEMEGVLERVRSKGNCGCNACYERCTEIEWVLDPHCRSYFQSREDCVDSILCMVPQARGPRPSARPIELDGNDLILTVTLNVSDSKVRVEDPENELSHRSEVAGVGPEGGEPSGFGNNVVIPDNSLTAANDPPRNNRQEVLEEFVKAMTDRRIIFESPATDTGDRNEDHGYDLLQLKTEMKELCSIFVPRLLSLRLLEVYQEKRRVLLERQQMYRQWLQELIDEDERAVKE